MKLISVLQVVVTIVVVVMVLYFLKTIGLEVSAFITNLSQGVL